MVKLATNPKNCPYCSSEHLLKAERKGKKFFECQSCLSRFNVIYERGLVICIDVEA